MNQDKEKEHQTLLLAALLHDIGKFLQRTGEHRGRKHPEISGWFVRQSLGENWTEVEQAVNYHHLAEKENAPNQYIALTLVLADWLSSGERRELPADATGEPAQDPLISIFSLLPNSGEETYFPIRQLPSNGDIKPGPNVSATPDDYKKLWDEFSTEAKQLLTSDNFHLLFKQLLALLEKYTIFIPSATYKSKSDISLYHHLKSTAAIADCIYYDGLTLEEINKIIESFETNQQPIAYLVAGDISGIQDFIYNLRHKGALKSLRGRSLYLQLISEAIASSILNHFHLTRANIIFTGGGHFYILLPALPHLESQLDEQIKEITRTLLNAHKGRLSVTIATRQLTTRDFMVENFGNAWDELHKETLAREKRRLFHYLLDSENITRILGPHGTGGEMPACRICGEETQDKDSDGDPLCNLCGSFLQLGKQLHDARYIQEIATQSADNNNLETWTEVLAALGKTYRFSPEPPTSGEKFILNNTELTTTLSGFRFIATYVPKKNGETAELEDIAETATGVPRWGVVRMDVDNLGEVLKNLPHRSISRLSTFSYLLGYFFSARVQALAQKDEFKDKIYLAYAGGDDLFAIGAWSILPEFARAIYDEFCNFTSSNLKLSAGIFLAPTQKFPVYEAATLAGEAEKMAKEKGRDSITFLDATLKWEKLPEVMEIKQKLTDLLNAGAPRAIFGILRSTWEQYQQAKSGEIPLFPIWRLLYTFRRLQEREKELAQQIGELEKMVVRDTGLHPHLNLITRWAELETRRKDAAKKHTNTEPIV